MKITLDTIKNICEIYGIKVFYVKLSDGLLGRANARTKTIFLDISRRTTCEKRNASFWKRLDILFYRPGWIRCSKRIPDWYPEKSPY